MHLEANGLHSAPDDMASEYEVGDFLYGLIRLTKPQVVLETGCYRGDTSLAIGRALKENGRGWLYTCDTSDEMCNITSNRCRQLPVKVMECTGFDLTQQISDVDMAFLDSSGDRYQEAVALQLSPAAMVILHDSKRPYEIEKLHARYIDFPTSRGLRLFF